MFRLDADKKVEFCDGVTRRDFVHAGALGFLGLTLPEFFSLKAAGSVDPKKDVNCIQLMLVGGPNQGIKGGRHLKYDGDSTANLLMAVMDKLGLPTDHVGTSKNRLDIDRLSEV